MTKSRKDRRRADIYNCNRKIRYETWDDAEAAMFRIQRESILHSANPPAPYVCPVCHAYHLGRQPPLKHSRNAREGY
jgi:hypothetical protein